MPGILDRYFIRELLLPFLIGLLIFTFLLLLDPLAREGERLIAKGVSWGIVGRVIATLLPQALAVTIPIALLIALLVALGRLSADRETVAMQACGISVFRLLRPVLLVATLCAAASGYVMLVALPDANQAFREIVYGVVSARVGSEVKPRVFYEDFPSRVLYVRDLQPGTTGWLDVFLADTTHPDEPVVYTTQRGRMVVDRAKRSVEILLEDGTRHSTHVNDPAKYEVHRFQSLTVRLDPESVFPRSEILKGDNEMTIPELRQRMVDLDKQGLSLHGPIMAMHRKFSIPVACFVFALIALGLGTSTGRGSKLASFVPGIGVVFVYYVFDYLGRQMAKGQLVPPALATWAPNIVLGVCGLVLLFWRARSADRPLRLALPRGWTLRRTPRPAEAPVAGAPADRNRVVVVIRIPQVRLPFQGVSLLDRYVARLFGRILLLAFFGMLGIFYISTFIDLSDKLFKGQTTLGTLGQYFYYATPQFVFYIIPLSVLIAAMVTIGVLTKSSELVVMKACGLSLYRAAAPLLALAIAGSAVMFVLQDSVLAYTNRRAESLKHVIRGGSPQTFDVVNRKWLVSRAGDVYNYLFYDPRRRELNGLSVFHFRAPTEPAIATRTYVSHARFEPGGNPEDGTWQGAAGWAREFTPTGETRTYVTFPARELALEPPDYFASETPEADRMTYMQLRSYIQDLRASGVNITPHTVQLHRKLAFPLVTLIMTLIAVPFATTTGRRGALYGIAVGIVLAVAYWIMTNAFGALGSAGALPPVLAAWAPNLIFGAGAVYMLLTVRT
jgi:LPS export ABC transporter permease LptG/LPS export ABC transporter permease LptF